MSRSASHSIPRQPKATRRSPFELFRAALELRGQRAHLAKLDDHLLHDIGLTRDDAEAEARRPIWDPPSHWFR
ncbi:MAG: DUF1127 domain-containing protein [Tabrizicola sp.]|uniref:DUF1127 domain-containing protein n=1 Tax=Tabrizicola sp. TaxID=2005166 RepID=UPI002735C68F|nr:DUF1127 domain-containing protein [Tabrizicola sp.]MDP3263027.1 DUF1127 domain-containing protein [Tabrizicola sp.]MDP3648562.1 DUF1127 domain-containing protein [Paracoccaceae bacterium]MDZ4070097.1 DUF1127 domain-containing protein [Tabrizicola sp.]